MQSAHQTAYLARINRVVDHISAHLAQPLDLQTLADVAHFSPWHFHRVFQGVTGETLADCVRRMRLEAAANALTIRPPRTALSIALDHGFGSAEVFSRSFRAHFGMTATAWRKGGAQQWAQEKDAQLRKIHQAVRKQRQDAGMAVGDDAGTGNQTGTTAMQVELKTLPAMRLAYLRYTGPYGNVSINTTWQRFMAWVSAHQDAITSWETYGISQDNPAVTPPEKCRYDCCVQVKPGFQPSGEIGVQDYAGGRYACARFYGTPDTIHDAWMKMFSEWMPASGYEPAHAPSLEIYEENFESDEKTGAFACWLCVPVQPL